MIRRDCEMDRSGLTEPSQSPQNLRTRRITGKRSSTRSAQRIYGCLLLPSLLERLRSGARVRFPGEVGPPNSRFFVQLRSERAKRLRCVPLRSSNESKSSDLVCTSDRTLCTSHHSVMYNRKAERRAGVVQWQYRSFPSFGRGFDSHRPLQKPC